MSEKKASKDLSFEEAIRELEKKADLLESEKLPLEKALEVVEESSNLAKICIEKLGQMYSSEDIKER